MLKIWVNLLKGLWGFKVRTYFPQIFSAPSGKRPEGVYPWASYKKFAGFVGCLMTGHVLQFLGHGIYQSY